MYASITKYTTTQKEHKKLSQILSHFMTSSLETKWAYYQSRQVRKYINTEINYANKQFK